MFEEADNFADIFRGGLPYYLLLTLPIIIICCSSPVVLGAEGKEYPLYSLSGANPIGIGSKSNTFPIQRLSMFDINGVAYGCRASSLSLEAKSLYTWSTGRHCVVARLQDVTIDQFREIRSKAGGLIILLPKDIGALSAEEIEHINYLEQAMLAQSSSIPVYFSRFNPDMAQIIDDITRTASTANELNANKAQSGRKSAVAELFDSISANGYQVVVSGASHTANKNSRIPIIQGELAPTKYLKQQMEGNSDGAGSSKLPTIILTAHMKTFGLYNEYPLNIDAAVLMTIAELFSKLQNTPSTTPKFRLLFLLSESGALLNFQGVKKWLDENVQLQQVDFVLCLDTIRPALEFGSASDKTLFMHVSKPPKDGSAVNNFFTTLKVLAQRYDNHTVEGVHKKINLAETNLAWEHERFSMKRLPAFTLSALKSPNEPVRTTVFKNDEAQIVEKSQRMAKLIAEALAHYVYNLDVDASTSAEQNEIFSGVTEVPKALLKSYMHLRSALHNNDLKNAFEKYLKNVKVIYDKPDAREPDFMLYEGQEATLNVYRVKPAVFDLFLTVVICAYLAIVYLAIQHFHLLYNLVCRLTKAPPAESQNSHNFNERSSRLKAN